MMDSGLRLSGYPELPIFHKGKTRSNCQLGHGGISQPDTWGGNMLTLGSKAKYGNHDCIVVGRTIEAHSRYDLLFPSSRRVELNVPEKDLEPFPGDDQAQRAAGGLKIVEGVKRHS
jgi:hypothetical protein